MRQVITFCVDGSVSGLQHKKGRGVDLRQFGEVHIERASHIIWSDMRQRWLVEFLTGPYTGQLLDCSIWKHAVGNDLPMPKESFTLEDGTITFQDYDDAVSAEVATLDGLRLQALLV